MYRRAEFALFNVLSWLALFFALTTLVMAGFYFSNFTDLYRRMALVFLFFSFFFELQIFMYKITVIEKRMLYLVGMSEQHFRIAKQKENIRLVAYFLIFWIALMVVILAYTPPS